MNKAITETIIASLKSGPQRKSSLIEATQNKTKATLQGVYKALHILHDKEIIIMGKKSVGLSLAWMDTEVENLHGAIDKYRATMLTEAFLDLKLGESKIFKFKTLKELDLFWVDIFLLVESQISSNIPMYVIIPHDWFSYLRPNTDHVWVRRLRGGRNQGIIITHAVPFDKKVSKKRNATELEFVFNQNPLNLDEKDYINIIDSWIFHVTLDNKVNHLLVDWIKQYGTAPNRKKDELDLLLGIPGRYILKITNSQKRADALTRKIKRYFSFTLGNKS